MTVEQYYAELEKKGISPNEFKRRSMLLFFLADVMTYATTELDQLMNPYGAVDGNLKHHISKCKQHSEALIRHVDRSLKSDASEQFGDDADAFKKIVYGWIKLSSERPFIPSDLLVKIDQKSGGDFKVITKHDIKQMLQDVELKSKTN